MKVQSEMKAMSGMQEQNEKDDLQQRLRCVEGHVRGVTRMLAEDEACPAVLRQLEAIQGALDKVRYLLVREYLASCIEGSEDGIGVQELPLALTELSRIMAEARDS